MVERAARLIRGAAGVAAAILAVVAGAQEFVVEGSCREGEPHGSYELRGVNGQLRVAGAYTRGKRTGTFLFWSSTGARVALLPFDDDVLAGTLALWYLPSGGVAEPRPKLEATFVAGRLHGIKRSWHPNGRLRTEYRYDKGALVEARAFGETGNPANGGEALAAADLLADERYYASLLDILRANRPRCAPGTDRLERG